MSTQATTYVWQHYQASDLLLKMVMLAIADAADDNGIVEYADYETFKTQIFETVNALDASLGHIEYAFLELDSENEITFLHTPPQLKMVGYLKWLEVQS